MNPNEIFDKIESTTAQPLSKVSKFFYVKDILAKYDGGELFREVISAMLKVMAILTTLGGLWMVYQLLDLLGDHLLPAILAIALFALVTYSTVHTLWIRGNTIAAQQASEISVTPIMVVLIRMVGEIYSFALYAFGVVGFVICLIGGDNLYQMGIPGIDSNGIGPALMVLVSGLFGGFLVTLFAYFWAELINIGVSMARNLEKLAGRQG